MIIIKNDNNNNDNTISYTTNNVQERFVLHRMFIDCTGIVENHNKYSVQNERKENEDK